MKHIRKCFSICFILLIICLCQTSVFTQTRWQGLFLTGRLIPREVIYKDGNKANSRTSSNEQNMVVGNDYGDRLEILGFEPTLPATLPLESRLYIKIAYQLKSTTNCRIWARPYTNGRRTPGYFAHPSPLYKKGSGELIGWFGFKKPGHVDQVRVEMVCGGKSVLVLTADIDVAWSHF